MKIWVCCPPLGLSLKEVAEYYYDTEYIDCHLQRLLELRDALDRNIQMLQVRSAKRGDLTVHSTALPRQVCFCRQYQCADTAEAATCLRDTYIAAALCIYYRGPYEGTGTAVRALAEHIREHNIQVTGPFRSIYLEGPPNRGDNSADYITQVAVPVMSLP